MASVYSNGGGTAAKTTYQKCQCTGIRVWFGGLERGFFLDFTPDQGHTVEIALTETEFRQTLARMKEAWKRKPDLSTDDSTDRGMTPEQAMAWKNFPKRTGQSWEQYPIELDGADVFYVGSDAGKFAAVRTMMNGCGVEIGSYHDGIPDISEAKFVTEGRKWFPDKAAALKFLIERGGVAAARKAWHRTLTAAAKPPRRRLGDPDKTYRKGKKRKAR